MDTLFGLRWRVFSRNVVEWQGQFRYDLVCQRIKVGRVAESSRNLNGTVRTMESEGDMTSNSPYKFAIILLTVLSLTLCFAVFMLNLEISYLRNIDYHKAATISRMKEDRAYTLRVTQNLVQLINRKGGM